MANKNDKKSYIIAYLGKDISYWNNIQKNFPRIFKGTEPVEFKRFSVDDEIAVQHFVARLVKINPVILYIDKISFPSNLTWFVKVIKEDPLLKDIVIAILSNEVGDIQKEICLKADLSFVKCGEMFDSVYSPCKLAFNDKCNSLDFARAKPEQEIDLFDSFRVGYITTSSLRAEGNCELKEDSDIYLETNIPARNVPSKYYNVVSVNQSNIYYGFNYAYDLEFRFSDPIHIVNKEERENIEKIKDDDTKQIALKELEKKESQEEELMDDRIRESKKRHRDWLIEFTNQDHSKMDKLLIVDKALSFLNNKELKLMDQYPFSIRLQTTINEDLSRVKRLKPSVIAFQLFGSILLGDDDTMKEIFKDYIIISNSSSTTEQVENIFDKLDDNYGENSQEVLEQIRKIESTELIEVKEFIEEIIKDKDYQPFIVIFNSYLKNTDKFREYCNYSKIFCQDKPLNFSFIEQMFELLQKQRKNNELKPNGVSNSEEDYIYYVDKDSSLSYAVCRYKFDVLELTESDIIIAGDVSLAPGNYWMDFPTTMSIKICPNEEGNLFEESKDGKKVYNGLINMIDEKGKQGLRRYINEVFFRPLKEQREKEQEDYWRLHKQKLIEKESGDDKKEEPKDSE